ncbi:MAG TPA: tetratricopeptide repeat protein [Drouetiella sp.]|jgi:tetratricopeptide (TPR) repeat protein
MDSEWDEVRSEAERAVRKNEFERASQLWLQAIALCNDMVKYDPRRIISLEGLANVYWRTNQFADALPILVKTFSLHEDQLGPDHADIGVLANNLARVYHTLEKFQEAEALYQRALRIRRKVLGVEHPEVAELIKNYANLLVAAGRGFEAEDLKASTVSIKTGIWNRSGHFNTIQLENPDTLYTGEALHSQPSNDEGAVNASRGGAAGGSAAPEAVSSSANLTTPPYEQPDQPPETRTISDAEITAESSELSNWLSSRRAATPAPNFEQAERPEDWRELLSKGMEAMQQNNTLQAEQLLKRAVRATDGFEETDPRIASTLELYSEVLWKNGKLTEAQPVCERTLQFYEATLPPNHQDIAVIANNLAMLYHALEKPELAEPLYKRALEIRTANQGTAHPDVITLLNNYANMLYVWHREGEAVNLKNYIRSLSSGKWNQVGKFKALTPTAAQSSTSSSKEDQFATYSQFKPSMEQVDWLSQSSDMLPAYAQETDKKPEQPKEKPKADPASYSNDPRAVLNKLVGDLLKKPGES